MVALARAQIAEPSVLILDEATSAVDPETERALSEALRRLSEGRTTVTLRTGSRPRRLPTGCSYSIRVGSSSKVATLISWRSGAAKPTSMRAGWATLGRRHDLYTRTRAERGLQ